MAKSPKPPTDEQTQDAPLPGVVQKAPDSQIPTDPSKPLGETSQDPLGTGSGESGVGNFYNDPTDNRAIPKQSQAGVDATQETRAALVERSQGLPEGVISRDQPRQSPSPEVAERIAATAAVVVAPSVQPRMRDIEVVQGETVELTAPHYINDVLYETGTILEDYSGPKSQNMKLATEGEDYIKAATLAQKPTFRPRGR